MPVERNALLGFPQFVVWWNRMQGQTTPAHHKWIAQWLERRWQAGDRHLLLMAFRNSGKSTLVGLFAAWLLLVCSDHRILVLAADLSLARKMVRNARRIVERHPAVRHLRPRRADQWASDQFTVARRSELRDPSMLARGVSANLTGSRADIVICDDVEVPNTCDTAVKRSDLRARLTEVDYVMSPGGLQLYVGTPHTYYTLYARQARVEAGEDAPFLDGFRRLEVPLVMPGGDSAWPERFDDRTIERIRGRTGANKFESQMQLRPVNIADSRLEPDRLKCYEQELFYHEAAGQARLTLGDTAGKTRLVSASCWWDPAFGAGRRADGSVVAVVYTDGDGALYLHRVLWLNATDTPDITEDEATRQCRLVARLAADMHLPSVAVETNGVGRFLPSLLRRVLKEANLKISVREITSRKPKDVRILESFDALLAAGALSAHRSVWNTPFINEMREWRPGAQRGHDDGLDAVAGALSLEPVRLKRGPAAAKGRTDWRPGVKPVKAAAGIG